MPRDSEGGLRTGDTVREAIAVQPGMVVRSTSLHDKGRRFVVRHTNAVIYQLLGSPGGEGLDAVSSGTFVLNFEGENGEPLEERGGGLRPDAHACIGDEAWGDKPLPEDDAIKAAFPTRSGRHDLYAEAVRLVGAKRSKYALVSLVTWLLLRIEEAGLRPSDPQPAPNVLRDLWPAVSAHLDDIEYLVTAREPHMRKHVMQELTKLRKLLTPR
jgi:hypothetical protein